MMNKLTIFWNDRSSDSFRWYLSGNQALNSPKSSSQITAVPDIESEQILKADLACLADTAHGKNVHLVLSCNDVHFNQVTMPNKGQRHLRKAVPYLLEEQVAQTIDELFFALGNRQNDGKIPVRGITLEYLQAIITQFKSAEIELTKISIDLDLLSVPETGSEVVLLNDKVLVSEDSGQRWSCNVSDFSWLAQKQLALNQGDEDLPVAIPLTVLSQAHEAYLNFEHQIPVGRFAPLEQNVESIEQTLSASKVESINLLQGDFEPKVENSPLKQILTKVASIAAIVLVAHLIYQGSQLVALEQQKTLLSQQRTVLWKQAFPGRKVPANPDKALRSFMRTLGGGDGESSFLALLQSTSASITSLNDIYPTNISYDSSRNELRVDLVAKDLPILNQYRDDLKQTGHQVEMSSATQRGDGYSSRLIIRK